MKSTLIIGYGNADRQDDGAAWHVLCMLNARLGRPLVQSPDDEFTFTEDGPELRFVLQLAPEMAEDLAGCERSLFVDAHTGAVPLDVNFSSLAGEYQTSPFTHHLTAETLLALTKALYGRQPQAALLSVRGYEFGFETTLSPQTAAFVGRAAEQAWKWLQES